MSLYALTGETDVCVIIFPQKTISTNWVGTEFPYNNNGELKKEESFVVLTHFSFVYPELLLVINLFITTCTNSTSQLLF